MKLVFTYFNYLTLLFEWLRGDGFITLGFRLYLIHAGRTHQSQSNPFGYGYILDFFDYSNAESTRYPGHHVSVDIVLTD